MGKRANAHVHAHAHRLRRLRGGWHDSGDAIIAPRVAPVSSERGSWWINADRSHFASMMDQERPRMCACVTYLKVPLRIVGLIEGGPFEGDPE